MRYAAGAFFGELALLRPASNGKRAFTVKATAASRCLRLSRRQYIQLCPAYASVLSSPARPVGRPTAAVEVEAPGTGAVDELRQGISTGSLTAAAVSAAGMI